MPVKTALVNTTDQAEDNLGVSVYVQPSLEAESTFRIGGIPPYSLGQFVDSGTTTTVTMRNSTTRGALSPGAAISRAAPGSIGPSKATPESRSYFRSLNRMAEKAAEEMLLAAKSGDFVGVANSASKLDESLGLMWSARKSRDDERYLGALITPLQAFIRAANRGETPRLEEPACNAIGQYVGELLGTGEKSKEDLSRAVQILKDAGYDPFDAISEQ